MAVVNPDVFYLIQRTEVLSGLLRQKERELQDARAEVEGLRVQLRQREQHILELEGRLDNNINAQPARKRARGEFSPVVRLNTTTTPWSSLAPSTLREKKAGLRKGYLEPCFSTLPTNIVKANCFGWAWYLGVDMQLYILAPVLLVLLYKKPKLGLALIISLLTGSMIASGLLQHFLVNGVGQDYVTAAYPVTYARMGPYMVGLLLGYIFFKTGRKVPNTRRTKVLMLLGWVLASCIAVFFLQYVDGSPAWRTFDRTMFSCAVAWVVFACGVGYGGIITEFLSWSGWVPLSRLTYTAYLVHPVIMYVYNMSLKTPLFYSEATWWFYFIAYSFMAFLCGFVASIMVELPFFGLEKLIFPQRRGRDSSKVSNNATNEADDNQTIELEESGRVHGYPVDHKDIEISGPAVVRDNQDQLHIPEQTEHWTMTISTNKEQFDHKF